jgi:archaellum component FlaC
MPDQELGHVKTDINRITTLLESEHQGYQRELEDIGLNANADEICKRLKDWFSGQSIRESDWVIVYISGHGGEKFGQHWLYTFDSEENNQSLRKAIKTSSLVEYFFEGKTNCPNVLLILDVCEAGKGATQAISALTQAWNQGNYNRNNNFSVLAAVSSRDLALDGYFMDALEAAIKDESWMQGEEIEFLEISALKNAINKILKDKCKKNNKPILKSESNTVGDSSQAEFIRNPKHIFKGGKADERLSENLHHININPPRGSLAELKPDLHQMCQKFEVLHQYKQFHFELDDLQKIYSPFNQHFERLNSRMSDSRFRSSLINPLDTQLGTSSQPISTSFEVFISYAHEDLKHYKRLDKSLATLKQTKLLTCWYDGKILAGQEWDKLIQDQLDKCQIILLLVSPDFLASDYCQKIEITRAIERHEMNEARVIPIILRPCLWTNTPFAKLQALPSQGKPVTKWETQDDAFLNIVQGIQQSVGELKELSQKVTNSKGNSQPDNQDLESIKNLWNQLDQEEKEIMNKLRQINILIIKKDDNNNYLIAESTRRRYKRLVSSCTSIKVSIQQRNIKELGEINLFMDSYLRTEPSRISSILCEKVDEFYNNNCLGKLEDEIKDSDLKEKTITTIKKESLKIKQLLEPLYLLVKDHNDIWQDIESDLERIEATLSHINQECYISGFNNLKDKMEQLSSSSTQELTANLQEILSGLESSQKECDYQRVISQFQTFRNVFSSCYKELDKEIINKCNELDKHSNALFVLIDNIL